MNRFFKTLLVSSLLLGTTQLAQAQAMIPSSKEFALKQWRLEGDAIGFGGLRKVTTDQFRSVQIGDSWLYGYQDKRASLQFSAYNDCASIDFSVPGLELTDAEIAVASRKWLSKDKVLQLAGAVQQKLLPASTLFSLEMVQKDHLYLMDKNGNRLAKVLDANISRVIFKVKRGRGWGVATLMVSVDRIRGKITSLRWNTTRNRDDSPIEVPNPRNLDIALEYDEWLLPYQELLSADRTKPVSDEPNHKLPFVVTMNAEPVDNGLFYPPRLIGGTPVIYSGYFPSFMISAHQERDGITLTGQLPGHAKTAVLTLGKQEAMVEGKPIQLSSAPQKLDGQLYLPYELLTLCGDVSAEWDAAAKVLTIQTFRLKRN